jgi:spermidine synthase
MSCPPAAFLEESFLHAVRDRLSEGGILVVNIVARAKAPHITVPQKLLKVIFLSHKVTFSAEIWLWTFE